MTLPVIGSIPETGLPELTDFSPRADARLEVSDWQAGGIALANDRSAAIDPREYLAVWDPLPIEGVHAIRAHRAAFGSGQPFRIEIPGSGQTERVVYVGAVRITWKSTVWARVEALLARANPSEV